MSEISEKTIELLQCPFCGLALKRSSRPINPSARCVTEECYGAKMPVVNLDVPSSVKAWNTREALPLQGDPKGCHELVGFLACHADRYQRDNGLDGLHPVHYDLMQKYGARMDGFRRATSTP